MMYPCVTLGKDHKKHIIDRESLSFVTCYCGKKIELEPVKKDNQVDFKPSVFMCYPEEITCSKCKSMIHGRN